jgi:hypothetical protein
LRNGLTIEVVLKAWRASAALHDGLRPGAAAEQLDETELMLRRRLPATFRAVYEFSNGIGVVGSNTLFYSLDELATPGESAADRLRKEGWPLPDELVVFGGDGLDGRFGLWLPEGSKRRESAPVIGLGEIFEEACMAVAGTGVVPFLAARTAYYLRVYEEAADTTPALDVLGVPAHLRSCATGRGPVRGGLRLGRS